MIDKGANELCGIYIYIYISEIILNVCVNGKGMGASKGGQSNTYEIQRKKRGSEWPFESDD